MVDDAGILRTAARPAGSVPAPTRWMVSRSGRSVPASASPAPAGPVGSAERDGTGPRTPGTAAGMAVVGAAEGVCCWGCAGCWGCCGAAGRFCGAAGPCCEPVGAAGALAAWGGLRPRTLSRSARRLGGCRSGPLVLSPGVGRACRAGRRRSDRREFRAGGGRLRHLTGGHRRGGRGRGGLPTLPRRRDLTGSGRVGRLVRFAH